jgi:HK97 family phage prohead protease
MPYSITDKNPDCSGWAVVDPANKVFGCHTTKASAIKQAVAISLATDEPFVGERKADGAKIIICDIDGTLLTGGNLIQKTWDYVQSLEGNLFIVTGRPESERAKTISDLHSAGVTYSRLIMNPGSTSDSVDYKKATAEELLKTYDVVAAIENNPDALRAYRSLGIDAINPITIKRSNVARIKKEQEGNNMTNRALPDELAIGDTVAWVVETEAYAGVVSDLLDTEAYVDVWDEEDGIWSPEGITAVVPIADLKKISPLVSEPEMPDCPDCGNEPCTCDPTLPAGIPDVPFQVQSRDKWIRAAWAIKAKLEGSSEEARSLGKNEVRTNHIELRAEGDGRSFTGYAALFDQPSLPLPFTEYVKPGAFKRSLQSRNRMMLLWNHDTSNPLASTRNGSLQMVEDARGLKVTATLPDTTLGRDIAELVRTGVVDSMSFGFSVKRDSWSQDGQTRYLEDVSLYEVSLVSTPAYEATAGTVSVRSGDSISADTLAEALFKVENGEELDAAEGAVVADVISRLTKTEEVQEVEGDILALKQKKLALLMMGI